MSFEFLGRFLDRAMRTLYMADLETFNEIFGEGGPHLWIKFSDKYDKSESDFICSLDSENLTWLATRVLKDMADDTDRLKELNQAISEKVKTATADKLSKQRE